MKRKSPIRHKVRAHTREGKKVKSFERGSGSRRSKHRVVSGRTTISMDDGNPNQRGYRPYLDVRRRWNDTDIYWIEEKKLFGKPLYAVKKAYWAKPVIQTTDRERAERFRDAENAHIYLISKIKDRKFLIGIAEKVGLTEDELEGFSNASVIGEITGSDEFQSIMGELAMKVSEGVPKRTEPRTRTPRYGSAVPDVLIAEDRAQRIQTEWENRRNFEKFKKQYPFLRYEDVFIIGSSTLRMKDGKIYRLKGEK